jgi:uncharacterized protein (TIRG00374 family)
VSRGTRVQALLAAGGLALLAVLIHRTGTDTVLDTLSRVQPAWLGFYAGLVVLLYLGFAIRWRILLRALGADVPLGTLYGARLAGLAVGSLTPAAKLGGEPLRALLLAQGGVPAGTALASVVVDRGVELVANVVFGIGYCALFALRDGTTAGRILIPVAASGVALLVGVVVVLRRLERGGSTVPDRFRPVLQRLGAGPETVRQTDEALRHLLFDRRRLVLLCVASALVLNAVILAEYATLFTAFGAHPTLPELAGAMLGVGLAHALPIPGALGALEGAQAAVFELSGAGTGLAIVAATVARLRDLVWTVPGAVYLALRGPLALRGSVTRGRS